jgi:hypothetical protein
MIRHINIISLTALLLLSSISLADESVGIVPNDVLLMWGYESKGTLQRKQSTWEVETFNQASILSQKIRSLGEVNGWKGAYYRFNLIRETYVYEESAAIRLKSIGLHPPEVNTKMESEYVLRSAFKIDNSIYLVTTDVVKFEYEMMPKVKSLFKEYVAKTHNKQSNSSQ